ncbi:hypothetical protein QWZ08_14405 [Ferruginibacter paludis]|uniref:hypothetical protein n=1 Tax=Ferruginibacter paludis TaxID=1310417 RepID=UPI0025B5479B|nr:hypothetical protein [Ferruginibacter paludis]MDN3656835.1 hypothetical protein [Ferruginibacter paludis]
MKKKACIYLLTLIICSYACNRGKYFSTNIFSKGNTAGMQVQELDSTYHLYLREVYKDKNYLNENVLKTNVEKSDTINKIRIEVEYLLISWTHKNALYISTIPDKYQRYYAINRFADTLLNAYDFSTFHFGKIDDDGESISFLSGNKIKLVTWDIRPFINGVYPPKIFVREIAIQRKDMVENVILINKALEEPLGFIHQNSFTIIFEKPGNKKDTCTDYMLHKLYGNRIYFNKVKHGFDIYFRFDKNINNSGDSAIGFEYQRTRYPPF